MIHISKGRLGATLAPLSDGGMLSQILRYNDYPITFRTIGGALMVNATQMAKQFGKRPSAWLQLPMTRKFISIIQRERLEAILAGIKSQIDTAQGARLPISTPTLF